MRRRPTLARLDVACIVTAVTLLGGGIWSYTPWPAAAHREAARATEAEEARKRVQKALTESRKMLIRSDVNKGISHADNGYWVYALPWLIHALRSKGRTQPRAIGRMRLGTVLRQSDSRPALVSPGPVSDLAFSPDGKRTVTSSGDGPHLGRGQRGPVGEPLPHEDVINRVAFNANGQTADRQRRQDGALVDRRIAR